MADQTLEITYWESAGEVNTDNLLKIVRECALQRGIPVIVASETGKSALRALQIFKDTSIRMVVVTHFPATTWGPKGNIPIGLLRNEYTEARKTLLDHNITIVQGTRPFAPPSRSIEWGYPTPEAVMDKTLELFGAGTKIAIEAAIMATDSGAVTDGEEILSCAGTFKGLDCALIVKTTYSTNVFSQFEVREVLAKPRYRVTQLPEYTFDHWKGDLEQYY